MAIEEPAFERLEKVENIEIRQYRPVIVAETFVDGDMGSASNDGFRLIADYIFGNNLSVRGAGGKSSEKNCHDRAGIGRTRCPFGKDRHDRAGKRRTPG